MQTQTRKAPALGIKRGGRYADGVVPEPSIGGFLKDRAQAVIASLGGGQPATGSPTSNPVADAVTNNSGLAGSAVSATQSYNQKLAAASNDYADGTPLVQGPGSTTSDSIPVNVSHDEAILPADTVKAIGADNLASIIQATHTPVKGGKTGYGARRGGKYANGLDAAPEPLLPAQQAVQAASDAQNPAMDRIRYASSPSQNPGARPSIAEGASAEIPGFKNNPNNPTGMAEAPAAAGRFGMVRSAGPAVLAGLAATEGSAILGERTGNTALDSLGHSIKENIGEGINKVTGAVDPDATGYNAAKYRGEYGVNRPTIAAPQPWDSGAVRFQQPPVNGQPTVAPAVDPAQPAAAPSAPGVVAASAPAGNTMQVSGNGHTFTGSGDVSGYSGEWQGGIGQHQGDGTKTAAAAPAWDALDSRYRAQDAGIQAQQDGVSGKPGQHLEVPFGGGVSRVVDDTPAMTARLNPAAAGNIAPTPPDMTSFPDTFAGRVAAQHAQQNYAYQESQYKAQAEIGVNRAKVANEQQNVQSEMALRTQQGQVQAANAEKQDKANKLTAQIQTETDSAKPDFAKIKRLQAEQYALVGRTQPKTQIVTTKGTDENGLQRERAFYVDENNQGNEREIGVNSAAKQANIPMRAGALTFTSVKDMQTAKAAGKIKAGDVVNTPDGPRTVH